MYVGRWIVEFIFSSEYFERLFYFCIYLLGLVSGLRADVLLDDKSSQDSNYVSNEIKIEHSTSL